ncbi:MAG TPA: YihY/virulence factor BrkB family protein [Thermodesulfobacteriota bacterium]|jgi:membrane protein|nr:YihY/virulence factor BrkB family protein [Thermodesulfobacteriota bacterium]
MVSRILNFFKIGIWEIRFKDLPPVKTFFVKYLRIILLSSSGFMRDNCQKTASVLTYYSLLNVVPVVAVAFAMAKGFGLEKLIEKQILQIAAKANWQTDITNQVITFSHRVLEQAKGGLIAGVGIVLLFWTVISIMGKIEESLNEIWEVKRSRSLARKFSDYIAMMVLGPFLLIISSSVTVLVASQVKVIVNKIAFLGVFGKVILLLLNLLPYVSIWTLLTMLYLIMPNTKIPLRSAIVGGIFAGTIAQIVQWIYIKFQIGVASYGAIYGSFAALPLFLGMLQMSWMIVLFGAEIAYASEHYETFGFHPDYSRISVSSKKLLMLRIFHLLTKKFSLGERPLSAVQIAHALEIPVRLVRQLLYELTTVGLVVETIRGIKSEIAFQPGRTIENITVKVALDEYEKYGITRIPNYQSEEADKISKYLQQISETVEKSPSNVRLKEI